MLKTGWVITDGSKGMEVQCTGLADALDLNIDIKRITTKAPWKWLPPALWLSPLANLDKKSDALNPPWPDVLITCGRQSIPISMAIKKASGTKTFTIHIQTPNTAACNFDLVIVPQHDKLRGPNVLVGEGALSAITPEKLASAAEEFRPTIADLAEPIVTVLVGGSNGCYDVTADVIRDLSAQLKNLHQETNCSFLITTSRRTGSENEQILKSALQGIPHQLWTGNGENPYFAYLALADALIVTGDSVNMVCEACSMGKPVYVFELAGGNKKFNHFHRRMNELGYTRPFKGKVEKWKSPPLLETQKIAEQVLEFFRNHT